MTAAMMTVAAAAITTAKKISKIICSAAALFGAAVYFLRYCMKKRLMVSACLLAVFAVCAYFAVSGRIERIELQFAHFLNPNGAKSPIIRYFTDIGEFSGVFSAIVLLLLLPVTRKNIGLPVGFTVFAGWIVQVAAKIIFHRARPEELLIQVSGYSFPSGHSLNSTTLYISVMLFSWQFCKSTAQRTALAAGCIIIPFMIGISRIYFNVHFLTDVCGGWCLGAVFAILGNSIYNSFVSGKSNGRIENKN